MFSLETQQLSSAALLDIIRQAREAEICRDLAGSIKIFAPIWSDLEKDPDFTQIGDKRIEAKLRRLGGFMLSNLGKMRLAKGFQERGADLLTQSIEMFQEIGLRDEACEANVMLALCYWYKGSVDEADIILAAVEDEYDDDRLNPVYLQICINRLMCYFLKHQYDEAYRVVIEIADGMRLCTSDRLKAQYHNEAGIVCWQRKKYDEAINHYKNGAKCARRARCRVFEAMIYNNLAHTYKDLGTEENGFYDVALKEVARAVAILEEVGAEGWLAGVLDTKAEILLEQGHLYAALETINRVVASFRQSDDYLSLTGALRIRAKIYFALERVTDGIFDFVELIALSRQHVGEFRADQFSDELNRLIYVRKNPLLKDELKAFKKHLVVEAIAAENLKIVKSAERLGVSGAYLYEVMNVEFPEIYDEMGIVKRKSPSPRKTAARLPRNEPSARRSADGGLPLQQLRIPFSNIIFTGGDSITEVNTSCFVLNGRDIPGIKMDDDVIVLCDAARIVNCGKTVVIARHHPVGDLVCAITGRDPWTKIEYLSEIGENNMNPVGEYKLFGAVIGYCLLSHATGDDVTFAAVGED